MSGSGGCNCIIMSRMGCTDPRQEYCRQITDQVHGNVNITGSIGNMMECLISNTSDFRAAS